MIPRRTTKQREGTSTSTKMMMVRIYLRLCLWLHLHLNLTLCLRLPRVERFLVAFNGRLHCRLNRVTAPLLQCRKMIPGRKAMQREGASASTTMMTTMVPMLPLLSDNFSRGTHTQKYRIFRERNGTQNKGGTLRNHYEAQSNTLSYCIILLIIRN